MIGFFVNTLVLRTDFSGNPSFVELLRRVKETSLEAYAHQDLPFEKLVEELNPQRDMSHSPLFQVMFVLQNVPIRDIQLEDIILSPIEMERETAKFDLTTFMVETDRGLTGSIEYNKDLFNDTTIALMIDHFRILLEGIVGNPDQGITDLPILTGEEKQKILVEWNDTKREYPRAKCIHELFEEQVEKTPNNIAVVFEDEQLTYRELNERANQLAHYLIELGVGPEIFVGICMERSIDMIVALLGILKAGGAYVPLDPSYPKKRLAFMLQDSNIKVLLTQNTLADLLPCDGIKVVLMDSKGESMPKRARRNPIRMSSPDDIAYVMYTSGSTGNPKGVQIHHRSLTNFLISSHHQLGLTSGDIIPAINTFSFDISTLEIFLPLVTGARISLISREIATDGLLLSRKINQLNPTMIHATPATWKLLFAADWKSPKKFKSLCGGEELSRGLANLLLERSNLLLNVYGPTETTVYSTFYQVVKQNGSVPIGRPIANTKIFILDKSYNPVPIGIAGELHIGGDGLSRGYLNRPDLTAEKFMPNPFSEEPGERLYKTGDLARYLPDGNIAFLGRIDLQVKIRGYRIETGEIEFVLREHPRVRDAVVVTREDEPTEKRLVAYLLLEGENPPAIGELRVFLMEKLPEYMVPSSFEMVNNLPLTPTGKIDRKALPEPETKRPEILQEYVAPRNLLEKKIADIWSEVLGVDRVGVYDNFFDLGGNSLEATKLIHKISLSLQREVSVKTLFLNPTISDLVNAIAKSATEVEDKKPSVPAKSLSKEIVIKDQESSFRLNDYIVIERRPLLTLIKDGQTKQVDAAAIGYLSNSILDHTNIDRKMVDNFFRNKPIISNIVELGLGRVAIISIPIFESELYADQDFLVGMIKKSLELAGVTGAKTVSLTGLIPSATDYGRAIYKSIDGCTDLPQITTGHATTTSSVVLSISRTLKESGRELANEKVGFLGLGSVGMATLCLMLRSLPHPKEITLCDLFSKRDTLEKLRDKVIREFDYIGNILIVESGTQIPSEFYENSLIIGATNVPEVIDINLAKPGTIIVDDSAPHCFSIEDAIRRFENHGDIIFTEGGVLRSPKPVYHLQYMPDTVERLIDKNQLQTSSERNPFQITGCVLSGLLSSRFDTLKPTLGLVDAETSYKHYEILKELGFDAAELHCEYYVLDKETVKAFKQKFGSHNNKIKKDIKIGIQKSPLVNIQPLGSKRPFFCVHAIGGSVFSYYDLSKLIGKDQPFYGLESIGMEGEAVPLSSIEKMAARYIEAIRPVRSDGPYQIGGWSMGGLVAYEMAQQLLAQGQPVSKLVLFDSHSLSRNRNTTKKNSSKLLGNFLETLCIYFKNPNTFLEYVISDLPNENWSEVIKNESKLNKDTQLVFRYRELAKILGTDPNELNLLLHDIIKGNSDRPLVSIWKNLEAKNEKSREAQLQHAIRRLDVYLNNLRAIHKYNPRPYPGRLTLIRAKDHLSMFEIDQTLGWGKLARGGVEVYTVPGNHYTMFNRPNAKVLAEKLISCIKDARDS
ncbi:MAG: amino acid adenylation domain-containing protein [Thermodesulfobacteriota bacterium]